MERKTWGLFQRLAVRWLAAGLLLHGCATVQPPRQVRVGEKVAVNFTCRFKEGLIAATTDPTVASDVGAAKSPVFLARKSKEKFTITAGTDPAVYGKPGERGFESEIVALVAEAIEGMKVGETRLVELKAFRNNTKESSDQTIRMARVRRRPKEIRMSLDQYEKRTASPPEVGKPYIIDPAVPGEVVSVKENEVVIRFQATPGTNVATPLGNGIVRESADQKYYEIVLDAHIGSLVRSGGMVGRIVDVEERMITIDYGHPFGGEKLTCNVTIESVEKNEGK